jgi:hypothetical protein
MRIENEILAALKERRKDINNLGYTLRAVNRADENQTSIKIVQELILKDLCQ